MMTRQKTGCLVYAFLPLVLLTSFLFASPCYPEGNDYKKKVEEKLRILKFKVLERQARLEAENAHLTSENQRLNQELSEAPKKGWRAKRDKARQDKILRKDKIRKLTGEIETLQHALLEKDAAMLQLNALVKRQEKEIADLKNGEKKLTEGLEGEIAQLTADVIIGKNHTKDRYR